MARRNKVLKLSPLQKEELKLAALGGKTRDEALEVIDDIDLGALERYLLSDQLGRAIAGRFAYNLEVAQTPKKEETKANKLLWVGLALVMIPALFLFNSFSPSESHSFMFTDSSAPPIEAPESKGPAVKAGPVSETEIKTTKQPADVNSEERWFDDVTLDQHQRLVYAAVEELTMLLYTSKETKRLEHAYHPITGDKEPLQRIYSHDLREEWEFVTAKTVIAPIERTKELLEEIQKTAQDIEDGFYSYQVIPPITRAKNWATAERKRIEPSLRLFQALDRRASDGRKPNANVPTITDVIQKEEQRALSAKLNGDNKQEKGNFNDGFISRVDDKVSLSNRELWKLAHNPNALALLAPIAAVRGQKNAAQWMQSDLWRSFHNKHRFESHYTQDLARRFAQTGTERASSSSHEDGGYTSKNLAQAKYEYDKRDKVAARKFKVTLFQLFQIVCERNQGAFLSPEEANYFLNIESSKKYPRRYLIVKLRRTNGPAIKKRKPPMWVRNFYLAQRSKDNRL